jgi:hypothetical protein
LVYFQKELNAIKELLEKKQMPIDHRFHFALGNKDRGIILLEMNINQFLNFSKNRTLIKNWRYVKAEKNKTENNIEVLSKKEENIKMRLIENGIKITCLNY